MLLLKSAQRKITLRNMTTVFMVEYMYVNWNSDNVLDLEVAM